MRVAALQRYAGRPRLGGLVPASFGSGRFFAVVVFGWDDSEFAHVRESECSFRCSLGEPVPTAPDRAATTLDKSWFTERPNHGLLAFVLSAQKRPKLGDPVVTHRCRLPCGPSSFVRHCPLSYRATRHMARTRKASRPRGGIAERDGCDARGKSGDVSHKFTHAFRAAAATTSTAQNPRTHSGSFSSAGLCGAGVA
ncbi:hypothetical protein LMG27174_06059 [Paraburkholderia rhynchosiae]|uniref:Uncharacterized protein n=1 Tax=Paraburkholderia rhynchosiae TaxID=487049 RepID=A0A6J5CFQ5_9BURK|nr:hypothetical protein LMG27174_06059 [Paraburkholderia rhynchosiae]